MKPVYLRILFFSLFLNFGLPSLASPELKQSCEQMESEIILAEELVLARTVDLTEIPSWYFGIPGLIRFGIVIEPALEEADKVFGPEFRLDLYEKTPQFIYNAALAVAYPTVMAALVPGDIVKVSYFSLTKKIIEKRLKKLKERYQNECEVFDEV